MRSLLASMFLLTTACAVGQTSVADVLRTGAKRISAADLPDRYRAVSLGIGDTTGYLGLYAYAGVGGGGTGPEAAKTQILMTLITTSFVDPDEFAAMLEGKRPRIRAYTLDLVAMTAAPRDAFNFSRAPVPQFAESWIEAGRIVQWSPRPSVTKEAIVKTFEQPTEPGSSAAEHTVGLSNIKQIAMALMMFAADENDKFPRANSTEEAKRKVDPYLQNAGLWATPNKSRVLYNTALSGVSQTSIEDVAGTLLLWEEKPYPDGKRAVAFTDGHVKRLNETEWNRLWTKEMRRRALGKSKQSVRAITP